MHDATVVLGLLACVAALVPLAGRLGVPYPILLVVGGILLSFIPNSVLTDIILKPELVFVLFLPPLLFWASLTAPWREFQTYMRPILLPPFGLVVVTMTVVAVVAQAAVPALDWSLAFVLGAIVSPADVVAAMSGSHPSGNSTTNVAPEPGLLRTVMEPL